MVEACAKRGVRFFADTPVDEVVEENGAITVKTARGNIRAGHAVVATNSPIVDRVALHSKMSPYRTYVIGFAIAKDALPDALIEFLVDHVRRHIVALEKITVQSPEIALDTFRFLNLFNAVNGRGLALIEKLCEIGPFDLLHLAHKVVAERRAR